MTLEANLKLDNKWYKLGLDLLRTETQSQGIYKTLVPNLTNKDITITKHQHYTYNKRSSKWMNELLKKQWLHRKYTSYQAVWNCICTDIIQNKVSYHLHVWEAKSWIFQNHPEEDRPLTFVILEYRVLHVCWESDATVYLNFQTHVTVLTNLKMDIYYGHLYFSKQPELS